MSTFCDNRPSYDGYIYKENEYSFTNLSFRKLSQRSSQVCHIQEVDTKYSNDSNCAAIEDRFGSGSPPIGHCKLINLNNLAKEHEMSKNIIMFQKTRCTIMTSKEMNGKIQIVQ